MFDAVSKNPVVMSQPDCKSGPGPSIHCVCKRGRGIWFRRFLHMASEGELQHKFIIVASTFAII